MEPTPGSGSALTGRRERAQFGKVVSKNGGESWIRCLQMAPKSHDVLFKRTGWIGYEGRQRRDGGSCVVRHTYSLLHYRAWSRRIHHSQIASVDRRPEPDFAGSRETAHPRVHLKVHPSGRESVCVPPSRYLYVSPWRDREAPDV